MYQKINVIASFNLKGQICPLWIQLRSGDELLTAEVLSSKEIPPRDPLLAVYYVFKCRIKVTETSARMTELRFHKKEKYWEISVQ